MKVLLLLAVLAAPVGAVSAQTTPAALAQRINKLMRDPAEPDTELKVVLSDCHITQLIRQYRTNAKTDATTIEVSHRKNGGDWSVRSDETVQFELTLGSEWSQVTALTYALQHTEKTNQPYYVVKVNRRTKSGSGSTSSTTLELPLYTPDEAQVQGVVHDLEKLRRSCGGRP
ncbi:hypothetical protein CDA63_07065 [Hymenobacter amundsenii]|uniref:Uncharacterized protein n=1 Tax=Hymenobacter amundsenii TaxID=2006685 RepID=A0A246FLW8_9BACT|nr:hypothetical protein [Hymenobacter amundsenii]OWP63745.1 hypothetical protein CDA63_07065 [Hymenobacter amundsenii]